MRLTIIQNAGDSDMYELWQLDRKTGNPRYLIAIVHTDSLEQEVNPGSFEETQMECELRPYVDAEV